MGRGSVSSSRLPCADDAAEVGPRNADGTHMTLIRDTGEHASWFWRAMRRLAQVDRRAALRLILSMSVNQIVTVLVFFLPLKVVLLVASDGVPRYFQFFISQDTKDAWLVGLAAAIFILYIVSIRLDTIAERSANQGARSLVTAAEQVPITANPEGFARTSFYRLGGIAAGLIFSLSALVLGTAIFPAFFLSIPVILAVEFILAAVAVHNNGTSTSRLSKIGRFVREEPQDLFRWLKQINFLIVFAVLLVVFIAFDGLNPLFALAAIMLSRRMFGVLKKVAGDVLKLSRDRHLVDVLLFPDARVKGDTGADRERLLGTALPSARLERLESLSAATASDDAWERYSDDPGTWDSLESVEEAIWVDSGQPRVAIFDLYGIGVSGQRERVFREYLYSGKASRGLEQHDYLLKFFDAETLRCRKVVAGYQREGLVGRIVDFRGISDPGQKEWPVRRQELLQYLWTLDVPASLVTAYDSAHPRLHERLRSELLDGVRVATDESWAQSTYNLLESRLPGLCERVAELPLTLFNGGLTRRNVVVGPDGQSYILDWTSWSLQPVGAGFAPDSDSWELLNAAGRAASVRAGVADGALVNDVLLASLLQRMHRLVKDGYPKAALGVASPMIPVLDQPDGAVLEDLFSETTAQATG